MKVNVYLLNENSCKEFHTAHQTYNIFMQARLGNNLVKFPYIIKLARKKVIPHKGYHFAYNESELNYFKKLPLKSENNQKHVKKLNCCLKNTLNNLNSSKT